MPTKCGGYALELRPALRRCAMSNASTVSSLLTCCKRSCSRMNEIIRAITASAEAPQPFPTETSRYLFPCRSVLPLVMGSCRMPRSLSREKARDVSDAALTETRFQLFRQTLSSAHFSPALGGRPPVDVSGVRGTTGATPARCANDIDQCVTRARSHAYLRDPMPSHTADGMPHC
jgi:hypothetical protein